MQVMFALTTGNKVAVNLEKFKPVGTGKQPLGTKKRKTICFSVWGASLQAAVTKSRFKGHRP